MRDVHASQKQKKMVITSSDFTLAHFLCVHLLPCGITKKAPESSAQTSLSESLGSTSPGSTTWYTDVRHNGRFSLQHNDFHISKASDASPFHLAFFVSLNGETSCPWTFPYFLEECKDVVEHDFNMFSPVTKIQGAIRWVEMAPILLEYRRPISGCWWVKSSWKHVIRGTTVWIWACHSILTWKEGHRLFSSDLTKCLIAEGYKELASRIPRIKHEDHCSGSILLQMLQLWRHVACTTDCIMSVMSASSIHSHRK